MKIEQFIADENERLDVFLSKKINESRSALSEFIKKSFVSVNEKKITKASHKLKIGDKIELEYPAPKQSKSELSPQFDVDIIYEDDDILVINKPSGVVVHDAPSVKEPTLVDWLKTKNISLSTISGEERHGIVHRLDKETSGIMVVAKNNEAHRALSEQLQDRSMGRYYLALIDLPLKDNMLINAPIARNPKNRLKMGIVSSGRESKSAFLKVALGKSEKIELIAAKLFSGRTHQIRVHLFSINRHILGDALYGYKGNDSKMNRIFLHAYILYLVHPKTKKLMNFIAPLPSDFLNLIEEEFLKEDIYEKIDSGNIISSFSNCNNWM